MSYWAWASARAPEPPRLSRRRRSARSSWILAWASCFSAWSTCPWASTRVVARVAWASGESRGSSRKTSWPLVDGGPGQGRLALGRRQDRAVDRGDETVIGPARRHDDLAAVGPDPADRAALDRGRGDPEPSLGLLGQVDGRQVRLAGQLLDLRRRRLLGLGRLGPRRLGLIAAPEQRNREQQRGRGRRPTGHREHGPACPGSPGHVVPALRGRSRDRRAADHSPIVSAVREPHKDRNPRQGPGLAETNLPRPGTHARSSSMTWPWTSVRRRSMPSWRTVSRLWSIPSRCRIVAWTS